MPDLTPAAREVWSWTHIGGCRLMNDDHSPACARRSGVLMAFIERHRSEARAEQAAEVERLRAAAVEVITETEAVRDAINGSGHPGEDHDHVLGDLLSPHHICDRVADCANCGGAQYGAEDRLNHAMGSLRLAVGMEVRPWEYPDREFAATPEPQEGGTE